MLNSIEKNNLAEIIPRDGTSKFCQSKKCGGSPYNKFQINSTRAEVVAKRLLYCFYNIFSHNNPARNINYTFLVELERILSYLYQLFSSKNSSKSYVMFLI